MASALSRCRARRRHWRQLPLPEHPECFASGDGHVRSPGVNVRRLQMPQGTVADVNENHVSATLVDYDLDGALAVQSIIFYKHGDRIVRFCDHVPFSFDNM